MKNILAFIGSVFVGLLGVATLSSAQTTSMGSRHGIYNPGYVQPTNTATPTPTNTPTNTNTPTPTSTPTQTPTNTP